MHQRHSSLTETPAGGVKVIKRPQILFEHVKQVKFHEEGMKAPKIVRTGHKESILKFKRHETPHDRVMSKLKDIGLRLESIAKQEEETRNYFD